MGEEPPSCDLMRAQPPQLYLFSKLRAYKNHYSVIKGYFRFKKTVDKLFLLHYTVILHLYVDLT